MKKIMPKAFKACPLYEVNSYYTVWEIDDLIGDYLTFNAYSPDDLNICQALADTYADFEWMSVR